MWRRTRIGLRVLGVLGVVGLLGAGLGTLAHAQQARPGQLYVVTFVDVTPDNAAEATKAIQQYVVDTRKDPGFVRSEGLVQDSRVNHFVLLDVWQSRQAFDAHEASAHTKAFRTRLQPMLGSPFDQRLHTLVP